MPFTLKSLRNDALEENNEVDHNWFSESFVERAINDAVRQINARSEWLRTETTVSLVKDQTVYSIGGDVIKVLDVKDGSGNDVPTIPKTEEDHYGTPSNFKYRTRPASNGQTRELVIKPAPGLSSAGNSWTVTYHRSPSELTKDGDSIPLPRELRPHIMDWVNFRIQRKDKEQTTKLDRQEWVNNFMTTMRTLRQSGERSSQIIDDAAQTRATRRSRY